MICIYHSRDLDGWMSAAIVKLKFPDVNLIGWDYGQSIIISDREEDIILVDMSFPPKKMRELGYVHSVTWIDHHASAIRDSIDNAYKTYKGLRDPLFAACELTWKYFFPEEVMPEIVRLLGRYDCFGHKGTDEEQKVLEFQYGARQCISDVDNAYAVLLTSIKQVELKMNTDVCEDILYQGKAIYKYLCTEAMQIYNRAFPVVFLIHDAPSEVRAYQFLCVNQERFNPVNFGINYHNDKHNGFLCFHYANGKWNFSLYNDNGEIDCSEICKMLGGGGHKGASGFVTGDYFIIKLVEQKRIELTPLK